MFGICWLGLMFGWFGLFMLCVACMCIACFAFGLGYGFELVCLWIWMVAVELLWCLIVGCLWFDSIVGLIWLLVSVVWLLCGCMSVCGFVCLIVYCDWLCLLCDLLLGCLYVCSWCLLCCCFAMFEFAVYLFNVLLVGFVLLLDGANNVDESVCLCYLISGFCLF